jgi:hypothetical protein
MEVSMATATSTQGTTGKRNGNQKDMGKRGGAASAQPLDEGLESRDELYGVISVLYHALQGAETYAKYEEDAEQAGDDELVAFFQDAQDEELGRAERAKQLLAARIGGGEGEAIDSEDEENE